MDHLQPDTAVYAGGTELLARGLIETRCRNLQPPPVLTLSQWAARYAVLSAETSAQTGRFRAYAYQVGMMDAVTDPSVTRVTIMKSARVGYTKILDHVVGYFIHQDPSANVVVTALSVQKWRISAILRGASAPLFVPLNFTNSPQRNGGFPSFRGA